MIERIKCVRVLILLVTTTNNISYKYNAYVCVLKRYDDVHGVTMPPTNDDICVGVRRMMSACTELSRSICSDVLRHT